MVWQGWSTRAAVGVQWGGLGLERLEEPGYNEPECQVEGLGFVLSPGMRSDLTAWTDLVPVG